MDNSLHIICQIELVPDFNKLQTLTRRNRRFDPAKLTKEYLGRVHRMFTSGDGSDCVIECGGQEFFFHKFALMAHSDVFSAMFSHKETLESVESHIRITDCTPAAVQQMLTYIYSGNVTDDFVDEQVSALIEISEKYQLEPLKIICQDKLISRMTIANVCAMLNLADTHNADLLMDACIPLVKSHVRQILISQEWAELKASNQRLVTVVLEKVLVNETATSTAGGGTVVATTDQQPPQKRIRLQDVHANEFHRPKQQ